VIGCEMQFSIDAGWLSCAGTVGGEES